MQRQRILSRADQHRCSQASLASRLAAPMSGGQAVPSSARSRRSGQYRLVASGLFFDPRPIGDKPPLDRVWVALSGNSLGSLRGEPAVPQPRAEVTRVEGDVQFPLDELA